jgi:hypothetical protein
MRGPEAAAELTAAWLGSRIPARLRILEAERGLTANAIGDPAIVVPYDRLRLGLEEWPAVLVVGQALRKLSPAEVLEDGREAYVATYALRVFVWVRGEDELDTDQLRKRYVLAVREALLERRTMTSSSTGGRRIVDPVAAPAIAVNPLSIGESYSDLALDDVGTLAGAWLDVDVDVPEFLSAPAGYGQLLNPVVTANADTATIPPHPAYS